MLNDSELQKLFPSYQYSMFDKNLNDYISAFEDCTLLKLISLTSTLAQPKTDSPNIYTVYKTLGV